MNENSWFHSLYVSVNIGAQSMAPMAKHLTFSAMVLPPTTCPFKNCTARETPGTGFSPMTTELS